MIEVSAALGVRESMSSLNIAIVIPIVSYSYYSCRLASYAMFAC